MSKHKKTFTIFGLAAAAVILAGAIFVFSQPAKQNDPDTQLDETTGNVAVSGIENDTPTNEPDITPDPITTPDPSADEQSGNDIPLTVIEDKPEPPIESALTNPDEQPDSTTKPAETTPSPAEQTPNAESKPGYTYIPGFGWVEDEGGGGQGEKTGSDGDWDKIIGH